MKRLYRYLTIHETLNTAYLDEEEAAAEQEQCNEVSDGEIILALDDDQLPDTELRLKCGVYSNSQLHSSQSSTAIGQIKNEILIVLKKRATVDVERVNREIICLGYEPSFDNGIAYGPFLTWEHIENQVKYLNNDFEGLRLYPELERPIDVIEYSFYVPYANPGYCHIQIDRAYQEIPQNLAIILQWAWSNPGCIDEAYSKNYESRNIAVYYPELWEYATNYIHRFTPYNLFNRELNKNCDIFLPNDSIRYLFAAQDYLKREGKLSSGISNGLRELAREYDFSYLVNGLELSIGRQVFLSCDRASYRQT